MGKLNGLSGAQRLNVLNNILGVSEGPRPKENPISIDLPSAMSNGYNRRRLLAHTGDSQDFGAGGLNNRLRGWQSGVVLLTRESSFVMVYDDGLVAVSNPNWSPCYQATAQLAGPRCEKILFSFRAETDRQNLLDSAVTWGGQDV